MNLNELMDKFGNRVSEPVFQLKEQSFSLQNLITFVALVWGFAWLAKWIEKLIHKSLLYKDIDPGIKGSIERFSRYLILFFGLFISLSSIGVNLNTLTAVGGVLLLGIGFGLQNITQNFVSGIIILLERPIKKGDIVKVGATSGRVLDIKARSTLILTRDDVVIIVPNSSFISEPVINDSFSGDKLRLSVDVSVAYETDIDKVTDVLMAVALRHDRVLKTPPPTVILKSFGESGLMFELRIWTNELWFSDIILSDLRCDIVKRFRDRQVTIPFPQRDLHFKSDWTEARTLLGSTSTSSIDQK